MKNKCIVKKVFFSKMLFENPVRLNMRLRKQPRSVTVALLTKWPVFFAKHIWQPYLRA